MRIVVDAMGGDFAPNAIVGGVVDAVQEFDINITLIGLEEEIRKELAQYDYPTERIEVLHAPEVVTMKDSAIVTLRKKKNSSIALGIEMLKDERYNAFVSAGNTGAVVAAATINLGMLTGVERPAIGLVIPTLTGPGFLLDVGATTDPKQQHFLQWGLLATVYSQIVLNIPNPRIGLLNIGEESSKGSGFMKDAHRLLSEELPNFIGNVEANGIFSSDADCMICDGYTGNVVIKVSQGLMESAATLLKREIKKSPMAILGAGLMKKRLQHIRKLADYSEYGGAPLLGVNGLVMISHGRSNAKAIKVAIRQTIKEVEHNILKVMREAVGN